MDLAILWTVSNQALDAAAPQMRMRGTQLQMRKPRYDAAQKAAPHRQP